MTNLIVNPAKMSSLLLNALPDNLLQMSTLTNADSELTCQSLCKPFDWLLQGIHVPPCTTCCASCYRCNPTVSILSYCNQVITFSRTVVPTTRCSMRCLSTCSHGHICKHSMSTYLEAFSSVLFCCCRQEGSTWRACGAGPGISRRQERQNLSLSFGSLDISCVDHLPEELIAVTIQGLSFSMAMGIGPEGTFQRMQLSLQNLQIDDQLSASRCVGRLT